MAHGTICMIVVKLRVGMQNQRIKMKESYKEDKVAVVQIDEVSTFFTNIYPTFNNKIETELDKLTTL